MTSPVKQVLRSAERTVWKYTLQPDEPLLLEGRNVRVVHVGTDGTAWMDDPIRDLPTVWVEHGGESGSVYTMIINFIGTGHAVPKYLSAQDGARYQAHVGSVVTPRGLVWHVYTYVEHG